LLDDDGDGLGDLCDALYCVVVDPSNPSNCLNPEGPFRVSAGGAIGLRVNDRLRLPLFANRNNAAISYTWTIAARPAGSTVAIAQPTGLAGLSRHWQYAYLDGQVPSFTADRAGTYTLQVEAQLGLPDRVYPGSSASVAQLQVQASP
jgi:hypothetical protein